MFMYPDLSSFSFAISSISFHFTSASRGLIKIPQHLLLVSHGLILFSFNSFNPSGIYFDGRAGVRAQNPYDQPDNHNSFLLPAQGLWKGEGASKCLSWKLSALHKRLLPQAWLLISVSYSPSAPFGHTIWGHPLVPGAILAQGISAQDPSTSLPFRVSGTELL